MVDAHLQVEALSGQAVLGAHQPSVEHQQVQGGGAGEEVGPGLAHRLQVGQVADEGVDLVLPAILPQLGVELVARAVEAGGVASADVEGAAGAGQRPRSLHPHARGASGDEDGFACQVGVVPSHDVHRGGPVVGSEHVTHRERKVRGEERREGQAL